MVKRLVSIIIFLPSFLIAQTEVPKGSIRSIREKLIFLDSATQNLKLFSSEGDYGHYGFRSPKLTFSRFNSWWYHTPWVHYLNYYRVYDKSNNLLHETWYFKNDTILQKIIYQYDKNKNRIQEKTIFNDSLIYITNYKFGYLNLPLTAISYSSFSIDRYTYNIYAYNHKNQLIEERIFDEYGESYGTKYIYTEYGQLKEKLSHSPFIWEQLDEKTQVQKRDRNGIDQLLEERFYDSLGNLIKVKNYVSDFNDKNKAILHRSTSYIYDTKNRKIGEYYGGAIDTIDSYKEFYYNQNSLLTNERFIQSKSNRVINELKYFYDKYGNIEKVIYVNEGNVSSMTFSYKFDKKLNWIEQLKSVDGKPLYLRQRQLQYH